MKKLLVTAAVILGATVLSAAPKFPTVTAHRGGHIKDYIPENSIAGVASAKRFGYDAIECDPKRTSDGVIVVMHDKTINRTMRLKEGYRKIETPVEVSKTTFEELRTKYVLASDDPAQRVQIPTLEELTLECKKLGMKMMLHSQMMEADRLVHKILGDEWICFANKIEVIETMRAEGFKGLCLFSTEERSTDKIAAILEKIGQPCGISSMDRKKDKTPGERQYTPEFIKALTSKGYGVQSSIFRTPWEVRSVSEGCDLVLSDFYWAETDGRKPSENWIFKGRKMAAGVTAEKSFTKLPEYGAILVSLEFKGRMKVSVAGHNYEFDHPSLSSELIGIRLYNKVPTLKLEAKGPCKVKSATAEVYSL